MKRNPMPTIGLLAGLVLIFWSISSSGDIRGFVDINSIIIALGGSFCALLISFPLKTLTNIPNILRRLLVSPLDNRKELIVLFSELAKKSRKDGLLALEHDIATIDNEFLSSGLEMVVDGVEPHSIRELLELKMDTTERRHRTGQEVFTKWAELAPAFGMIGTLIGLIVMLAQLDDPSKIGTGMAVALLTTFYGSILANLVFTPVATNLEQQTDEEMYTYQMIIDGIIEIQAGTNPRVLEEKLTTYLAPEEQREVKNALADSKEAIFNE